MRENKRERVRPSISSPFYSPKDARVDVILQRVDEPIGEELNCIPEDVRRYGVNNIFTRAFAYLIGWKVTGKPVKITATESGAVKVASVGAGLERTERKEGTATSTVSSPIVFSHTVSRLRVITTDYRMYLYPSPDGVTFYDPLTCLPDQHNVFDLSVKAVKVQTADINDVEYEIVGMW